MSYDPVAALFLTTVPDAGKLTVQLATVQMGEQSAKGGDDSLKERQQKDPELLQDILHLEGGVLRADDTRAQEIALTHSQYEIVDSILYHVEKDNTLRVIPATEDRKRLFVMRLTVELWVVIFEMPRSMASWPSTTGGLE